MSGEFVVGRPHPGLRGYVSRYIGYRQDGTLPAVHRGLPSRHIVVVISLAEPVHVISSPDGRSSSATLQGLVGGMQSGPALIGQTDHQYGLQLELDPLGARGLLGVSAEDLSGAVVELGRLPRPALATLPDRLASTTGWRQRFAVLDEVLLGVLVETVRAAPEVEWAWSRLLRAGGRTPVRALAGDVGWSTRHLGERFRREIGLAPKQAARVVRFERASTALRRRPRTALADLAAECGYYDQAHLTHEWRALAGCTPGTWMAEELPFLQESIPGPDSDW
ncbi:AraC family transcriptional regulator [Haloechinothrix sp. YIM 98757]|uniref:AraC family transcriptional regulator n=1 Tax=Haloechinothrix aidingensis TaxID=2752311 RepID=A0A838AG07_9PSEU|nr:AraC family transcriptional regulator [Haloechinothrix aidingensis]